MNFQPRTTEFYAGVRARLRGQPPIYGADLLPRDEQKKRFLTHAEPHSVVDPIPDQRFLLAKQVKRLDPFQQEIATRRALAAYSRARLEYPQRRAALQLMRAIAEAFKMDFGEVFGRNNCHATTAPRQIAMALLGPLTGFSRMHVGRLLARDHSTISYAAKKNADLIEGLSCRIGYDHG